METNNGSPPDTLPQMRKTTLSMMLMVNLHQV
jgi:hypothetical protein